MRLLRFFFALLLPLFFLCNVLNAQTDKVAAELINKQNFGAAYQEIIKDANTSNDAYLQYLLGLCYLFSDVAKSRALAVLNTAYDAKENRNDARIPGDIYYYLGIAKHRAYDFEGAMNHFGEYKDFHQKFYGNSQQGRFDHASQMEKVCQNAVDIINYNRLKNTIVRPLNFPLNSSYNDYYPVVPSISEQLVYASDRRSNMAVVNFGQEAIFLDGELAPGRHHMFYGEKSTDSNNWDIQRDFLTFGANFIAPVSFSSDGETLLLIMGLSEEDASLYITNLKNERWQEPVRLPNTINVPQSNIKGAALAANGNRIYFASNKEGGIGGYDIYVTNRIGDNNWTKPENLGTPVNTKGNEITPYVSANMQQLYFSSDSHETIGYYDIFLSEKYGTAWEEPQNLGYPINSTFNDICYSKSADGVKEMLSSDREVFMDKNAAQKEAGDYAEESNSQMVFSKGNYDIYEITRFKDKMPLCIVSGNINIFKDTKQLPFLMQVKSYGDNFLQPFVFEPESINGKYFMVLRGENTYTMNLIYCYDSVRYNAEINRPLYDTLYDFQFTVPKNTYHYEFNADIELKTSKAFGQEIATHIKANSSDFATTSVEEASIEKELKQIRFDALVLIMDRVTALGKKEVLADVGSLENKIEYIQERQAIETDKMIDLLIDMTGKAFENKDISYLVGLTEVMRHKDGLNVRPTQVSVTETAENIFNKKNQLTIEGKRSIEEIAKWVEQEVDGELEFHYYGNASDLIAQERVEEIRQQLDKLVLKNTDRANGYIKSNYNIEQKGKIVFLLSR